MHLLVAGVDVRHTNSQGLTALDEIHDYDEWIHCPFFYEDSTPYFTDDLTSRFKGCLFVYVYICIILKLFFKLVVSYNTNGWVECKL